MSEIVAPCRVSPKQREYSTRAADLSDGERLHVRSVCLLSYWCTEGLQRRRHAIPALKRAGQKPAVGMFLIRPNKSNLSSAALLGAEQFFIAEV